MNLLRKSFDNIVGLYIADFEEKHDCSLEYWVNDDTTGIACFGDHCLNLGDIVYDIDNECDPGAIFRWQDCQTKNKSKVNFKSYLMGAR